MPLDINQFSVVELAPTDSSGNWYRVERRTRRRGATVIAGYSLPPAGLMAGRFDVSSCVDSTGLRVHRWVARAQRGSLVPLI